MNQPDIVNETLEEALTNSQIADLRLAASKLTGEKRRAFQAEMTWKYCDGRARLAESIFGWGRQTVQLGLHEKRSRLTCVGAQAGFSGNLLWEERYPDAASALRQLAEAHAQQDPTFTSSIAYTRLTAAEALKQLGEMGFSSQLPHPSSMAVILNRMGYRLRKVLKAKPQKK